MGDFGRAPLSPPGRVRPAGFQRLQGRIHVGGAREAERLDRAQPVAFIAFDLLKAGKDDLCARPLMERRARLERLPIFRLKPEAPAKAKAPAVADAPILRLSEQAAGDGRALYARALAEHWEGLIAKDARSTYQAGRRSPTWRKVKVLQEQEFVVGGWTEPRQTRQYFGALLLGVYEDGRLGEDVRALRTAARLGERGASVERRDDLRGAVRERGGDARGGEEDVDDDHHLPLQPLVVQLLLRQQDVELRHQRSPSPWMRPRSSARADWPATPRTHSRRVAKRGSRVCPST